MIPRRIFAAVILGILLYFVLGVHPVAWLVWFAPLPLLLLAFRSTAREAAWTTALAVLIGGSVNFHYYRLVMPLPAVFVIMAAQVLLWTFITLATRRIVLRYQAWWTVFAFPVFWAAEDTLRAHLLSDGNWGSLAYSQADFLPILQVTSLFGVAGLRFLIALLPSALALAFTFGFKIPHIWRMYAATGLLLAAALGYGELRLRTPVTGQPVTFGLVAIDDAIGIEAAPSYIAGIWQSYDRQVRLLVAQGAEVIVLPEKIGLVSPAQAQEWQQKLSVLAAELHVWIEAGVGVEENGQRRNLAWLFTPQGALEASYLKHHMAPPEKGYIAGSGYEVRRIGGNEYGLAVCKDMHFAALGRAYGERNASVMLVPAWDFYFDGWLEARTTLTRGVENGYTVVRAAREGLLTVSDPYGRVLAESASSSLPGSTLLARANIAAPVATLYTRIGDLFGWLSVAAAAVLLASGRRVTARATIALRGNRWKVEV
jgi:apolipoprotein N-acyltransferase